MKIQPGDADLSERKTLKVSVPAKLHLQLHTVKILKGRNISDTVEAALEAYFDDRLDDGSGSAEGEGQVPGGEGASA